jgi:ABC-type transport system involved in multi-copper enzyme maturation permease subunit
MRWGLGPVFLYECLTSSRRWQTYALRSLGVAALLIAMSTIAISNGAMLEGKSSREYARLGVSYFYGMIGVELALVMLVAPAATAGAICLDRARGTLAHMLMTDLSDTEIVLGKLAARLMPVMGLVACSWPVMAISSLLGGIDPVALTLAFAIIVAMAVLGCTIALTLSVWAGKTHEVILSTYAVWILALLFWPIWYGLSTGGLVGAPPDWTLLANPFYIAFAPYAFPLKLEFGDYVGFFGVTLGSSTVLCLLAVWRTRPVACRGDRGKGGSPRLGRLGRMTRWLPGPSLDRDPVLWREWHRSRPTPWMTGLLALLMGTTAVLCIVGAVAFWRNGATPSRGQVWETAGVCSYLLHVVFGLLILSAVAPTSMAEERQRGSLDILAATSLSTWAIVIGKWIGTFRLAVLMVAGPGLMALAMATARSGPDVAYPSMSPEFNRPIPLGPRICGIGVVIATILAHGALITSIGIALAVWIKRQGRAIGVSVGLFILINAAWPIIANIVFSRSDYFSSRDLAALSPVALCGGFVNSFTSRQYGLVGGILWAGTFWAVEVFILAMGLLWLTFRTFDDCFDRLPDRPRRYSVQTIIAIILIGMIGGGSLIWAISLWMEGFQSAYGFSSRLPILPYTLAITIILVLIASEAATSIAARLRPGAIGPGKIRSFAGPNELALCNTAVSPGERESLRNAPATIGPSRFVLNRWWKFFRLVLLVAIGPALFAMSLATAQKAPQYTSQTTSAAMGRVTYTWTLIDPNVRHAAEVPLGLRLASVALLIVTILVHGAAGVGVGLVLATTMRWTRRDIAVVAGLTLIVVFIVPLGLFLLSSSRPPDITMWSAIMAGYSLLEPLVNGFSFHIRDTLWTVLFWDVVVGLFAAGMLWLTIRIWQRRALGPRDGEPALELESKAKSLDVEAVLIAD